MIHSPVAKLLPHDPGQGTAAGLADVGDGKLGGIQLVAGAQSGDGGDLALPGIHNETELAGNKIDAVGNIAVICVEEGQLILLGVELADGADAAVGVDVPDPVSHGLRLKFAQGGVEGAELAVEVGDAHGVVVDQCDGAHTGPGQSLCGVAAHSADAKDGNMALLQLFQGITAQGHLQSDKRIFHRITSFQKMGSSLGFPLVGGKNQAAGAA